MLGRRVSAALFAVALIVAAVVVRPATATEPAVLGEFVPGDSLQREFLDRLLATHRPGTWAPLRVDLTDADLTDLGLPSSDELRVSTSSAAPTSVVPVAGAGWTGIRPGALLLFVTPEYIGLCSAAHVYGSPGAFQLSSAGHCGPAGTPVAMPALAGGVPVVLSIGRVALSTGDRGLGHDWALIDVMPEYQPHVDPTMAFWGGPIGVYDRNGEVVRPNGVTVDTSLVQGIVQHGRGTPRTAAAINWQPRWFTAAGPIVAGDSGTASNTLTGGHIAAQRQCAGIVTHVYVDVSLYTGVGNFAGTRCTVVPARLAQGELVPSP